MFGDVCTAKWLADQLQTSASARIDDVKVEGDASENGESDTSGVLVLDCRSTDEHQMCHVAGSLPVTVPPIMLRRLRSGSATVASMIGGGESQRTLFNERWKTDRIVLYDNDVTLNVDDKNGGSGSSSIISALLSKLKSDGCRVCCLQGGFAAFYDKYSHMCATDGHQQLNFALNGSQSESSNLNHYQHCHHHQQQLLLQQQQHLHPHPHLLTDAMSNMRLSSSAPSSLSSLSLTIASPNDALTHNGHSISPSPTPGLPFPVEVVPNLYLGDAETSRDLDCLRRHNIRYILNVTDNVANSFEYGEFAFVYMRIPITDHWSQTLTSFFKDAIKFIDEGRRANHGVLVHCLAGISRSVTVTVAYLMYSMSLSLEDAFDVVHRVRPNIAPNISFMGQLLQFDKTLEAARTSCRCYCVTHRPCSSCLSDVIANCVETGLAGVGCTSVQRPPVR